MRMQQNSDPLSCSGGHMLTRQFLLGRGGDIEAAAAEGGITTLHCSTKRHTAIAQLSKTHSLHMPLICDSRQSLGQSSFLLPWRRRDQRYLS